MAVESEYRALAYHDPSIVTVLIIVGFILSSNAINYALDKLIFCGLVGQVLIGVAFGYPGLQWLSEEFQSVATDLGYIGLILIVYEGGLSTNVRILKANLFLSSMVAITGIALPIALSYVLQPMLNVTALQAFVAGAALCSTSLGTTFTVLQTSGLSRSRLGVILAGAAMMDDVVGLVLVQIVSTLGSQPTVEAPTIVRPIGVSLAYAILTPLACKYIVGPLSKRLQSVNWPKSITHVLGRPFWIHSAILVAFIATASFAGTSNLFAAYLAGACITWWDDERLSDASTEQTVAAEPEPALDKQTSKDKSAEQSSAASPAAAAEQARAEPTRAHTTGIDTFRKYYLPVVDVLLRPFFFASIGFSIPIAQMFQGNLLWRGIVYSILMALAKLACGLWLVRLSVKLPGMPIEWLKSRLAIVRRLLPVKKQESSMQTATAQPGSTAESTSLAAQPVQAAKTIEAPQSLYPASILGCAMVSRGEIGFLISAVAQSSGLYTTPDGSSQLFLVVTWAVLLCTLVGPITTGLLVKRVWRLQRAERGASSGRQDPLGIWGAER